MRLISITVRNYRILQQVRVDLDPRLTLIGAPNESGKSTLIEAAQRALFLRSKVTGAAQEDMQSQIHTGHPEVEVEFEAGGHAYHLAKRFSGASGTTKLTQVNGATLQGDEAEDRLGQLLGNASTEKRTNLDKVKKQWAHLWVWQGSSGEDPTKEAIPQHEALLQRLQAEGGSVVMQSGLDARVSAEIAARVGGTFTQRNQARVDSDLGRAEKAVQEAEAAAQEAADVLSRLNHAAEQHQAAAAALRSCDQTLPVLKAELEQTEAALEKVRDLRVQEREQQAICAAINKEVQTFQATETHATRLRLELDAVKQGLSPLQDSIARLETELAQGRAQAAAAMDHAQKAGEATRTARLRDDLAAAWLRRHELTGRHRTLAARKAEADALKEQLSQVQNDVARLPRVDKTTWAALQKLESAHSQADSAWRAIAASVELQAGDLPVTLGGTLLAPGEQRLITNETEVQIGGGVRLRIRPGGGTSLAEARLRAETALRDLNTKLDALGITGIQQAQSVHERRLLLESRAQNLLAELKGMDAGRLATDLETLDQDLAAADAEVRLRHEALPDFTAPGDLAGAGTLRKMMRAALAEAESAELVLRQTTEKSGSALRDLEARLEKERGRAAAQAMRQVELESGLRLIDETHGDQAARTAKKASIHLSQEAAAAALLATQKALASHQPELLDQDLKRLQRSMEQNRLDRQKAGESQAAAAALLDQAGDTDPQATAVITQARAQAAREHLARVRLRAQAVLRLHELFQEERRAMADHFTRPLAEKAAAYLRCLFGADAQVRLTLSAQSFTGLEITRPGQASGAFAFGKLSGGAREQAAAAVRLAMAEVLAASHDGCLPVVFDDAFAWSDPDRVRILQRMLNLAASRGLQIIVASCNPADYASLGAATVRLGP